VQGIDTVLRMVLDYLVGYQQGFTGMGVRNRYQVKQPGKQVTDPNKLSKALAMWCDMRYS